MFQKFHNLRLFFRQALHVTIVLSILAMVLLLTLFAMISEDVVHKEALTQFDTRIGTEIYLRTTPQVTPIFKVITFFGSQGVAALGLIVAAYFFWKREWPRLMVWILAIGGGEILNIILKMAFERARPVYPHPIAIARSYSFPSGHSMMSMIAYGMLAYMIWLQARRRWMRYVILFLAATIILLIGSSRLYLGVHFFSDVLGGFILGGMWLIMCIMAMEIIRHQIINQRETQHHDRPSHTQHTQPT